MLLTPRDASAANAVPRCSSSADATPACANLRLLVWNCACQVRDKEIKRLKLELQLARPEDKATIAAREKREAQIRTMHKRQASKKK